MTKRDIFAELSEGFDALASARAGKRTLRTHEVELSLKSQLLPQNSSRFGSI